MKSPASHQVSRQNGFTLVELLVAFVVLSIMLVGLATAMGYVSRLWQNGAGAMDNFTKARLVLNLLDRDIQMMVLRRDMAAFVDGTGKAIDSNGNTICAFYTNIQGYSASNNSTNTRTVSLVQYLLTTPTTAPTLQRLNYGMNYSSTSPVVGTGTLVPTNLTQLSSITAAGTDTVFTGIIRFQIQFIDGTGAILTPPYIPTGSSSTTPGPFSYDFTNPSDTSNPHSVVVSMLVLSNPAYILATTGNGATMTQLLKDFPNTLAKPNQTFSQYWNSILNPTTGTLDSTLPAPVRSGIQVFERHIPLPTTTPSS